MAATVSEKKQNDVEEQQAYWRKQIAAVGQALGLIEQMARLINEAGIYNTSVEELTKGLLLARYYAEGSLRHWGQVAEGVTDRG